MAKITVKNSVDIAAPRLEVFRFVATWQNTWRYAAHIGDLEQIGSIGYGLGTRLRGRVKLGRGLAARLPMEAMSEVVEFVEGERIVCRSVRGVDIANTWLFAGDDQATVLTGIVSCHLPGRWIGRMLAVLCTQWLVDSLTASLLRLKQILEDRPMTRFDVPAGEVSRHRVVCDLDLRPPHI